MHSDKFFLQNCEGLRRIYGYLPTFSEVNLHKLQLDWNGPTASLTLDLQEFPDNPPLKWSKFNTIQVELSISPLTSVQLSKFGTGNKCSFAISSSDNQDLEIVLHGETEARLRGKSAWICKISAYLNNG
ncbi:Imm50 family immunity protein [Achromobacter sp. NFACC18-2]|uniref:Imm50 family immunity protein n=1 Tax=Achromobacter sp. NFACC18-2 TaxID=1564112 RepID=UPI000B861652